MFSFEFNKKVVNEKTKNVINESNALEKKKVLKESSPLKRKSDEPKVSRQKLRRIDMKSFEDSDLCSINVAPEEIVKLSIPSYKDLNMNQINMPKVKSYFDDNKKKRYQKNSGVAKSLFIINDYCSITGGKKKGKFGQIVYVPEHGDCMRIRFQDGSSSMIENSNIKKLSLEAYKDGLKNAESDEPEIIKKVDSVIKEYVSHMNTTCKEECTEPITDDCKTGRITNNYSVIDEPIKAEAKLEKVAVEMKPKLMGWLLSGLKVVISDEGYMGGKYSGQCAEIDDVYEDDACACITDGGEYVSGLSSAMLQPLAPCKDSKARILTGRSRGSLVTVLDIKDHIAEVELPYVDDTMFLRLDHLCLCLN